MKNRPRKWKTEQLRDAVKKSTSIRQTIQSLGLIPAGGNYVQVQKYINLYKLNTAHFKGMAWNKGMTGIGKPRTSLEAILKKNSPFQSFKLKKRLFTVGLKKPNCEVCGWAKKSPDGRIPLELDHINGDSKDNRIQNLRVLCPNCHSLQPTHRGRNKKHY